MNTTYEPMDRDFLFSLALAKAKGRTWLQISEKAKMDVVDLEIIPWREPKEWAKACKYAEKLVHHEMLSETLAHLRVQMNDNVNNARLKTQVANSVVRVIQLQHALRTPKKPKKVAPRPTPEPTTTPTAAPATSSVKPTPPVQPTQSPVSTPAPEPRESKAGMVAVAAALLLLFGLLAFWSATAAHTDDSPTATSTFDTRVGRAGDVQSLLQHGVNPFIGNDVQAMSYHDFQARSVVPTKNERQMSPVRLHLLC